MKISTFISEILIQDNVDQEEKYLITSTQTLETRIFDKTTWENIKNNGCHEYDPYNDDLKKCLILVEDDKVGPVIKNVASQELQKDLTQEECAEKEIELIIERYHLGFPLPPIRPPMEASPAAMMGKQCRQCYVLPLCGGSHEEENPPCPPIKFNFKEKILLKYLFEGPKSVV